MKALIFILVCFFALTVRGTVATAAETTTTATTTEQRPPPPPTDNSSAAIMASAPAVPPQAHAPTVSSGCLSVGTVAEQIATWRDAHGSEYLAQIEVQRRLTDPAARNAALSIVTQLYTGFAKNLTPRQARDAYSGACEAGDAEPGGPATP